MAPLSFAACAILCPKAKINMLILNVSWLANWRFIKYLVGPTTHCGQALPAAVFGGRLLSVEKLISWDD